MSENVILPQRLKDSKYKIIKNNFLEPLKLGGKSYIFVFGQSVPGGDLINGSPTKDFGDDSV